MNLKIEEIKNLIEENNIDEIKKIINSDIVIRKLIDANDVDIIIFICDNLITDDITENATDSITKNIVFNLHFEAIESISGDEINETSAYILNKIFHHPKKEKLYIESLEYTESEHIYYMCQSENVEFIKLLHEAEIETDWNYIMIISCKFIQKEMVDFLIDNIEYDDETIYSALSNSMPSELIGKGCSDDPDQEYIISKLIKSNKVNVNIDGEEWDHLYLDCFYYVPAAAKYFFTQEFESECINSEYFWKNLLTRINTFYSDKEKSRYMDALVDLKNSDVNTDGLISIFKKLNQPDLVTILSNDQSQ